MKLYLDMDLQSNGCRFEVGYEDGKPIYCGKPAIAEYGRKHEQYLCREHYEYVRSLAGIHKSDVVYG